MLEDGVGSSSSASGWPGLIPIHIPTRSRLRPILRLVENKLNNIKLKFNFNNFIHRDVRKRDFGPNQIRSPSPNKNPVEK